MPKAASESSMGKNRTGMQMSPSDMKKMLANRESNLAEPTSQGDASAMADLRTRYIEECDPVGTVPPPGTAKGALKSGAQMLTGKKPQVFIDKLAERLAFERAGTRLYDALIAKAKADGGSVVPMQELNEHREQEAAHFRMLVECMEKLGGDPTAQTPAADLTGVEGTGLLQVVTDPKTTLAQSLHAMLVAELADNAAWDELSTLAEKLGQSEMAKQFRGAEDTEREHLENVKKWHRQLTLSEAGVS